MRVLLLVELQVWDRDLRPKGAGRIVASEMSIGSPVMQLRDLLPDKRHSKPAQCFKM